MENNSNENKFNKTNINWYPGHMAKTKRLIKEKIKLVDLVFEVIDARIPYSSKLKEIDEYINNKEKILIMTKIDLADPNETKKWIKYYQSLGYLVIDINLLSDKTNLIENELKNKLKLINIKLAAKDIKTSIIRALIVGVPNVGKSTLINALANKRAAHVGNKPGITKGLSWIKVNDYLDLLDTPGILWPKLNSEEEAFHLAITNAIREDILPLDKIVFYLIDFLKKYYLTNLKERYNLSNQDDDTIEILDMIGKKRGALLRGNEIDYDKVYSLILKDFTNGYLGKITLDRYEMIINE